MRLRRLTDSAVSRIFGDGLEADLASRGIDKLSDEIRRARYSQPERLTGVRLQPGEKYTVIARPPASKAERKAAQRERSAFARQRKLNTPTRRQHALARKMEKAQRRVALSRPGSRRHLRAVATEVRLGPKFDLVMTPSPKQARANAEYERAQSHLAELREASFKRARIEGRRSRTRRVRVYD